MATIQRHIGSHGAMVHIPEGAEVGATLIVGTMRVRVSSITMVVLTSGLWSVAVQASVQITYIGSESAAVRHD